MHIHLTPMKVLSSIKNLNKGKINILFGCGGNRDETKRATWAQLQINIAIPLDY